MRYRQPPVHELYRLYRSRLVLFARSFVDCEETAKDIVEDVFDKVLKTGKTFTSSAHEKNSLYLFVRNACYDYLRHKAVQDDHGALIKKQRDNGYELNEVQESEKEFAELMATIYAEIQKLPKRHRAAFIGCVLEEKPVHEVAAAMNISPKRVRNCVAEAKEMLRRKIQQPKRDFSLFKLLLLSLPYIIQLIKAIWIAIEHTVH